MAAATSEHTMSSIRYRNDIDGLRAIAVLAITAFHINPDRLPGGFIGVDVFFVISGFLITSIISRQLSSNTFSFRDFYLKRVRRLFPALFVMLLAVWVVSYFVQLPSEINDLARASIATVFYASNFYFYSKSGYFDDTLHTDPLVHTWSLGVEEQFYLIFPATLFLLYRFSNRNIFLKLSALAAILLVASQLIFSLNPSAAFYFSPARFWQFLAGAIVALPAVRPARQAASEAIGSLGLFTLIACILIYSPSLPFPALGALPPTLAVALVIYAGKTHDTMAGRLLSIAPARFIGKISYSLYLWHWPIIVFYKISINSNPTPLEQLLILLVTILFGALSYFCIERPTLSLSIFNAKRWCTTALATSALFVIVGIATLVNNGLSFRFNQDALHYASYLDYEVSPEKRVGTCFLIEGPTASAFSSTECASAARDKPNVLLIGDSHAAHYFTGLVHEYPELHFSQANSSGCRPILPLRGEPRCTELLRIALAELLPSGDFDAVIIAGRWRPGDGAGLEEFIAAAGTYVEHVYVIGPIVEYPIALPRLLATTGASEYIAESPEQEHDTSAREEEIRAAAENSGAVYVSPYSTICSSQMCRVAVDDVPLQFDYSHFTTEGSDWVVAQLRLAGAFSDLLANF